MFSRETGIFFVVITSKLNTKVFEKFSEEGFRGHLRGKKQIEGLLREKYPLKHLREIWSLF